MPLECEVALGRAGNLKREYGSSRGTARRGESLVSAGSGRALVRHQSLTLGRPEETSARLTHMKWDQRSEVHREIEQTHVVALSVYVHGTLSGELAERIRALMRNAARQLDSSGYLLQLWQPRLPFCEWRTLGVFLARNRCELRALLDLVRRHGWQADDIALVSPTDGMLAATRPLRQHPDGRASRRAACRADPRTVHVSRCSYRALSAVGAQRLEQ